MKKIAIILTVAALALQANSYTTTDRVKVRHSKPIYKTITKNIPIQQCWEEQVPLEHRRSYRSSSDPIGTLIGGIAGGIIGNQVGKGRGKTAATIGGAFIGTMVGHNLSQRDYRRNSYESYNTRYETRQQCSTSYTQTTEKKFMGYKNVGFYKGQKIVKRSHRKLRFIPIQRTVHY